MRSPGRPAAWPPSPLPPSLPASLLARERGGAQRPVLATEGGAAASGAPARPPLQPAAPSAVGCSVAAGVNGRTRPQRGQTPPPAESLCPDPPHGPPAPPPPPILAQVSSAPGAPSAGDSLVSGGGVWGKGRKAVGLGTPSFSPASEGSPPPLPPRPAGPGRFLSGVSTPSSRAWLGPAGAGSGPGSSRVWGSEARLGLTVTGRAASRSQCISSTQGQGPGGHGHGHRHGHVGLGKEPGAQRGAALPQAGSGAGSAPPCPPARPGVGVSLIYIQNLLDF